LWVICQPAPGLDETTWINFRKLFPVLFSTDFDGMTKPGKVAGGL
jgi:hypothetical protein